MFESSIGPFLAEARWFATFLLGWGAQHPLHVLGFGTAYALARWGLERKSRRSRECDRIIAALLEANKHRYRALRPMR